MKFFNSLDNLGDDAMYWALGVCVGGIALALLVPLRFQIQIFGQGRPYWVIDVVWFGWRVGRDAAGMFLARGGFRRNFSNGLLNPQDETNRSMGERVRAVACVWREASRSDRAAYVRLIGDLWAVLNFTAWGKGLYGFDDPAVTAWVCGFSSMSGFGERFTTIKIVPDFTRAGWWGAAGITCSVRVLDILVPAGRFLWFRLIKMATAKSFGGGESWQA